MSVVFGGRGGFSVVTGGRGFVAVFRSIIFDRRGQLTGRSRFLHGLSPISGMCRFSYARGRAICFTFS